MENPHCKHKAYGVDFLLTQTKWLVLANAKDKVMSYLEAISLLRRQGYQVIPNPQGDTN